MELGYSREIYLKTLRKIILQKPAFVDKVINKGKSPQMFSSSCKLLKMDAYANDFQKIFLAKILVIATRSDQIRQQLLQKLWSIFIFNKSKIYWKEILNRPPYFDFQKDIKVSTSKFCWFSIHQNHMHRVDRNDVQFSNLRWGNYIEKASIFCSSNYVEENTSKRCRILSYPNCIEKTHRIDVEIRKHFLFGLAKYGQHGINVILTYWIRWDLNYS